MEHSLQSWLHAHRSDMLIPEADIDKVNEVRNWLCKQSVAVYKLLQLASPLRLLMPNGITQFTCYPAAEVTFPPLPPLSRIKVLVLGLPTPEGCKAVFTKLASYTSRRHTQYPPENGHPSRY